MKHDLMSENKKILGYDPMTGEPIYEGEEDKKEKQIVGYDPMTGEPIYDGAGEKKQKKIVGYDPMNGEPIYDGAGEKKIVGYDPMTGEPICDGVEEKKQVTMSSAKDKRKGVPKKGKSLLGIIFASVAVAAVVVVGVMKSGVFMKPTDKVLYATVNTVKDCSHLINDVLNLKDILSSDTYTVDVEGEYVGCDLDVTYAKFAETRTLVGSVKPSKREQINFSSELTEGKLSVQMPDMNENIYTYLYDEDKDGYIADVLGESVIEKFDDILEGVYNFTGQQEEGTKKKNGSLDGTAEKLYELLDFEEISSKNYEVNGKKRNCRGYETIITSDDMEELLELVMEHAEAGYEIIGDKEDLEKDIRDAQKWCENMSDLHMKFYVYKNKLTHVETEVETLLGEFEIEMDFKGGKTKRGNLDVSLGKITFLEAKWSTEGKKEELEISVPGHSLEGIMEYDYGVGDFGLELNVMDKEVSIEGTLWKKADAITISLNKIEIPFFAAIKFEGNIVMKKNADKVELLGEVMDVGNMSEDEFEDFADDIMDYMEDLNFDTDILRKEYEILKLLVSD